MKEIFHDRDEFSYQLRQASCFRIFLVTTVFSGTESIRFRCPKIWDPDEIKCRENMKDFKIAVKMVTNIIRMKNMQKIPPWCRF